jgi:uncharacterized membrane protein YccC
VQQALGECVHAVARFLSMKAAFYRSGTDLEEAYTRLIAQQVLVNEKQEAVRELLFKSRLLVKESTTTSRRLLLTFIDLMDLYEQVTFIHYDYAALRERFAQSGILDEIAAHISRLTDELDKLGYAIQANVQPQPLPKLLQQLEGLKDSIDRLEAAQPHQSVLVFKKVLVNLRSISQRITAMHQYFYSRQLPQALQGAAIDYSRFVQHQSFDPKLLVINLSPASSIFKHAFRVAIACLLGYVLTKLLPYGEHSYWVLLTIIVILKPAFSLSKQRNYHRLLGTLIGGAIGFCLLLLIGDPVVLFVLLVLLMVGSFSFIRTNYIISVILMTPFVLIIFSFLGANNLVLVQERVLDTLMGSAIALGVSYLIFPSWESQQLQRHMQEVLQANSHYLHKLADRLRGLPVGEDEYKLARKEVYVSSANLAASFQRMLSEPRRKQRNSKEVHKFVVLNHMLSANIATLAAARSPLPQLGIGPEGWRLIKRSMAVLKDARKKLGYVLEADEESKVPAEEFPLQEEAYQPDHQQLQEQLEFLHKLSTDIRKTTETVLA